MLAPTMTRLSRSVWFPVASRSLWPAVLAMATLACGASDEREPAAAGGAAGASGGAGGSGTGGSAGSGAGPAAGSGGTAGFGGGAGGPVAGTGGVGTAGEWITLIGGDWSLDAGTEG